jgi:hypothetical protein
LAEADKIDWEVRVRVDVGEQFRMDSVSTTSSTPKTDLANILWDDEGKVAPSGQVNHGLAMQKTASITLTEGELQSQRNLFTAGIVAGVAGGMLPWGGQMAIERLRYRRRRSGNSLH